MKRFYYLLVVVGVVGAGVIGWQVMVRKTVSIPANGVVTAADTAGFQAVSDRCRGKPRPMLLTPEALLLRGGDQRPIANKAGGRIAVKSINAQDVQGQERIRMTR